jgi:hypothetical protein
VREDEHDEVVLRQVEPRERRAVAFAELRPVAEEERHVRANAARDRIEAREFDGRGERSVREPERGRGVRATAAEAGRNGDALVDPSAPALRVPRRFRKCPQRRAHEGVAVEAGDVELGRRLDRDQVAERESLEDRRHLVFAIGAPRADDEGEVELRRCRRSVHNPRASSTNSSGASA